MFDSIPVINDRRIRCALIGCGRISTNHIKALAIHNGRVDLVAICDTDENCLGRSLELIKELSCEGKNFSNLPLEYTSFSRLLEDVARGELRLDLVILTTPSGLHARQCIAAARLGLHVCTEKPMATRWSDGLEMLRECDNAGVHLFVVKQNRFNSTLQLLKRQIDRGRFGQLSIVNVNVFWQRPQSYYDQVGWRGTWEFDGGALMNQASHYVDLLDWLIGPVDSVSASTATLGRQIEVEDTAALQVCWRNGALGTMAVTMLTYPKNLEGSITILGEKGTVKISGSAVNKIEHWEFEDQSPDDQLVEAASYQTTSVYGFGHPPYYENLLDTLNGLAQPLCDGRQGLRSLELLTASYRSARSRQRVYLPLDV